MFALAGARLQTQRRFSQLALPSVRVSSPLLGGPVRILCPTAAEPATLTGILATTLPQVHLPSHLL